MFKGSIVALATPMFADGVIDEESVRRLIEWHITAGTDGLVVAGTTGEAAMLDAAEKKRLFRLTVEVSKNRVPVIAATAATSTRATIELTQLAMEQGVDACLIMAPPYVKPTQEGLYLHYKAIADAVAIPIILYNVPGRTICDLLPEIVERLCEISNIVGIKESSGQLERAQTIIERCGQAMDVYSGDDHLAMETILAGGKGVISVVANIVPKAMHHLCEVAIQGDRDRSQQLNQQLTELYRCLFLEANPIPVKWAMHEMGLIPAGIRLPLTPLSVMHHESLRRAMKQAGIIN